MATIPIEVIVQDAESPVDPTPTPVDPRDPGVNTNITVPDTGASIVDSNNGGINSSSAVISIVSIIIAILAIGAVIALLIRKYSKRNKVNAEVGMTRQEKRAMVATSTIAVLALTILLGQLVIAGVLSPIATNAASDDVTSDEPTYLDIAEDAISIVATRTEDEGTIISTAQNILYATTDAHAGYTVTMSMIADATNANLYLDGDETSEYYIAPVADDMLSNNTWGYSLTEEETYLSAPLAGNAVTIKESDTPAEQEEIDVYYAVKVDKDLPAGTYKGTVEYGIEGNYGFPKSLTTMQGMTHEICESVPTPNAFKDDGVTVEDNIPTATLTDIRDNKTYTVSKLADGKCWMTQNLDLQKEDLIVTSLDSTNTDNPAEGFELPNSQTGGSESWSGTAAHVYDLNGDGKEYYYCSEYLPWGACQTYSDKRIPNEILGNYYDWYAATAGTGTSSMDDGEVVNGSICPTGWGLPKYYDDGNASEFSDLLYVYRTINEPTSSYETVSENVHRIYESPILFMRSGYYSSGVKEVAGTGHLWTPMSRDRGVSYAFEYYNSSVYPWYSRNKIDGISIRCVAQ